VATSAAMTPAPSSKWPCEPTPLPAPCPRCPSKSLQSAEEIRRRYEISGLVPLKSLQVFTPSSVQVGWGPRASLRFSPNLCQMRVSFSASSGGARLSFRRSELPWTQVAQGVMRSILIVVTTLRHHIGIRRAGDFGCAGNFSRSGVVRDRCAHASGSL